MSRHIQLCSPQDKELLPSIEKMPLEALATSYSGTDDVIWFVTANDSVTAAQRISAIRELKKATQYLQPVVLVVEGDTKDDILEGIGDTVVTRQHLAAELGDIESQVQPIFRWVDSLGDDGQDDQLSVRVLRHLASRNQSAKPYPTTRFISGHVYPSLLPYFGGSDQCVFETLEFLQQQHFLDAQFVARAHHCFHCDSAFLNFEEACNQCGSSNLKTQQLIHHFRCGHVGPLEEFVDGDALICGKCGHELKHIGVDYDKPSIMYQCNDCNYQMQDPEVMSTCFGCHRKAAPENQKVRDISSYTVTPIGVNGAKFGIASLFTNILERDVGLLPWNVFERLVSLEASRIARSGRFSSSLLLLRFDGMQRVHLELGERAKQIFEAMSDELSNVLRNTDVVSTRNDSLYTVLLTETSLSDAERPQQRIVESIGSILAANLAEPPHLSVRLVALNDEVDLSNEMSAMLTASS